ncbi:mitochondrial folate carrier protein Flx1 [Peziza echinospora]|nr:mitochondrial folate carrier protein Flx1 [Peziza echinospora]
MGTTITSPATSSTAPSTPLTDDAQTSHAIPRAVVETIAGLSAGFLNTLAIHPLDLLKTRLQINRKPGKPLSSFAVLKAIARHETGGLPGARGFVNAFYRGLMPNLLGNTAGWGFYFLWYGEIKALATRYSNLPNKELTSTGYLLCAGAAGSLTALTTNPLWVIKTRMLSSPVHPDHPGAYTSLTHGLTSLLRQEGFSGLFRGMVPALWGVTHGAVHFMFYEKLKIWRTHQLVRNGDLDGQLSNLDVLGISATSKLAAGTITYPYQVVRARMQTYDAGKVRIGGAREVVKEVWRLEGAWGFYKG